MDFSVPASVVEKIKQYVEKKLFLKYYQNSHSKYLEHFYHNNWHDLIEYNFSFKIHLENIKKNDVNYNSFFMIKNISKNNILKNIKILITAESIFEKYIQNIYLEELDIDIKPTTIILNQIPFQELEFYDDTIVKKYDSLSIKIIAINNVVINKEVYNINPTYTTFLNDRWENKWGIKWNLKNIEDGKVNLKHYIYSKIAGTNISDIKIYKMDYSHPRRFFKSLLYKILTLKFFINILFWVFIWQNKIIEDSSGSLHFKKYNNTLEKNI